jgi:hypothetical protein
MNFDEFFMSLFLVLEVLASQGASSQAFNEELSWA